MRKLTKTEKKAYPQFKGNKVRIIKPLVTSKGNKSKFYVTATGETTDVAMLKLKKKEHPTQVIKALKRGYKVSEETFIY